MKQLTKMLFGFTLFLLGWFIIEGFLPSNTYTWRPLEAMMFQSVFAMDNTFYPNEEIHMTRVGDLCHHTPYAIPKNEIWKTDRLGNRNDSFISDPDVVILGDSFVLGDCITQDSTITNLLKTDLQNQLKVYNIGMAEFSTLDYYLKYKLIDKPKLLIFIWSERYVPMTLVKNPDPQFPNSLKSKLKASLKDNDTFNKWRVFLDKTFRLYSKNWIHARFSDQKGDGIPGKPGTNMFFWGNTTHGHDPNMVQNPSDFEKSGERIIAFKEYCDSLGIKFLYVPVPNKETVYYENVPLEKQPDDYISNLDSLLRMNNVKTINTLNLYNDYRKSYSTLLYHLDDSHWNSNAVQLVSKEIAKTIYSDYPDLVKEESKRNDFLIVKTNN